MMVSWWIVAFLSSETVTEGALESCALGEECILHFVLSTPVSCSTMNKVCLNKSIIHFDIKALFFGKRALVSCICFWLCDNA